MPRRGSMRRTGAQALPSQRALVDPSYCVENWDCHSVFAWAAPNQIRPLNKAEIKPELPGEDIVLAGKIIALWLRQDFLSKTEFVAYA